MDVTARDDAYEELFASFETASLRLLKRRELLRRIDSKLLLSPAELVSVIGAIGHAYKLVRTGEHAARARYETLYLDTPDLRCFHDHRRGRRPRHKVRFRHYPDRDLSYLEVKTKHNEFTTHKHRRRVELATGSLDGADVEFIGTHSDLPAQSLRPRLWTNFSRSTLAGIETAERITIDSALELVCEDQTIHLEGVVILEVKQARFSSRSPIMMALRACGLQIVSASKYCTGTVLHDHRLRFNRLKPAIRRVERLSKGRRQALDRSVA